MVRRLRIVEKEFPLFFKKKRKKVGRFSFNFLFQDPRRKEDS